MVNRFCLTPSSGDIPSTPINIFCPENMLSTPERRLLDQVHPTQHQVTLHVRVPLFHIIFFRIAEWFLVLVDILIVSIIALPVFLIINSKSKSKLNSICLISRVRRLWCGGVGAPKLNWRGKPRPRTWRLSWRRWWGPRGPAGAPPRIWWTGGPTTGKVSLSLSFSPTLWPILTSCPRLKAALIPRSTYCQCL